jgi:hypothetical protein
MNKFPKQACATWILQKIMPDTFEPSIRFSPQELVELRQRLDRQLLELNHPEHKKSTDRA